MGVLRRALLGLLLALLPTASVAQQASEAAVKAAFLFKFAGYVEWPEGVFAAPDAPFVIGVVGAPEVAGELEGLVRGRSIQNRRVTIRRVADAEAVRGTHVLFIGRSEPARVYVRAAQAQRTLAVTETERGLETGSSINFLVADDRVGFEVSVDAADRSGLRISSRMLSVARRVVPKS